MQTSKPSETGDDFGLWVLYSLLWSISGLVFWIASLFWAFPIAGDALVMLTLAVVSFGVLLRLPTLTHLFERSPETALDGATDENSAGSSKTSLPEPSYNDGVLRFLTRDDIVFVLLTIGAVNWAGGLLLHTASLLGGIVVLSLVALGEAWLWFRLYCSGHLFELFTNLPEPLTRYLPLPTHCSTGPETQSTPENSTSPIVTSDESAFVEEELDSAVQRRTEDGFDEEGRRFLSGEVRFLLAERQMSEEIVIGFHPAFTSPPDTDFELLSDEVRCRLVNVTPTGMRLAIRRSSNSLEEISSTIEWFALQISPTAAESAVEELP